MRWIVCVFCLAGAAMAAPDETRFPPAGAELPWDKLGLYIGINKYPKLAKNKQLKGCVNDVKALRSMLARRWAVERTALLRDEQATLAGVRDALARLLAQVDLAREALGPDKRIVVVLAYSGHGARLLDDGREEKDRHDDTWVCHDGQLRYEKGDPPGDLRDDEIAAFIAKVSAKGGEVVLFSDSCHSGTVHRDPEYARSRGLTRPETPATGAPEPSWAAAEGSDYAMFAACKESQQAQEFRDKYGVARGRFTTTLLRVLKNAPDTITYEALFRRLAPRFAVEWRTPAQTPQFHAARDTRDRMFLAGEAAPAHAVVSGLQSVGMVTIDRGSVHGFATGAAVRVYPDVKALLADKARRGGLPGTIKKADPLESTVCVAGAVRRGYVVRPERIHVRDATVAVRGAFPEKLQQAVDELAKNEQIRVVDAEEPHVIALTHEAGKVVFTNATDGKLGEIVFATDEKGAELLPPYLLALAREHMVMTLTGRDELLHVAIEAPRTQDGLPHAHPGEKWKLIIENKGTRPLYVYLLVLDSESDAGLVCGFPGVALGQHRPLLPGDDYTWPRTAATESGRRRLTFKVLASDVELNVRALVKARPTSGHKELAALGTTRGGETDKLLRAVLHGGPATRGEPKTSTLLVTGGGVLDVVQK